MGSVSGYSFECVDSCSCPATDSGTGGAQCGAVYDRMQASSCPFPADSISRADFASACDSAGARSAACRAEVDTFLACALTAPIECMDIGDGQRFPTLPSCPAISSMCLDEA